MNKNELAKLGDVARDVKWIVKEMKEQKQDITKQLDIHDGRITRVSQRTWVIMGILIATSALMGNGVLIR